MTEYKKQHYVPRFYLRNFSQNKQAVYRYDLVTSDVQRRNVNRILFEFEFYAGDSKARIFEQSLSELEDAHAKLVQKILRTRTLPVNSSDLINLNLLIILTAARTRAAKRELQYMANYTLDRLKPAFANLPESKTRGITRESFEKFEFEVKGPNVPRMQLALKHPEILSDMEKTLLINKTDPFTPFLTSDSPVIRRNLLGGYTGYLNKGLIIILPLSEEIALCLFDSERYKPKNVTKGIVHLSESEAVNTLNRSQIINADEFLIFSKSEYSSYVSSLQQNMLWAATKERTSLNLSFFEICNDTSLKGRELSEPRKQELAALMNLITEEMIKKSPGGTARQSL